MTEKEENAVKIRVGATEDMFCMVFGGGQMYNIEII